MPDESQSREMHEQHARLRAVLVDADGMTEADRARFAGGLRQEIQRLVAQRDTAIADRNELSARIVVMRDKHQELVAASEALREAYRDKAFGGSMYAPPGMWDAEGRALWKRWVRAIHGDACSKCASPVALGQDGTTSNWGEDIRCADCRGAP